MDLITVYFLDALTIFLLYIARLSVSGFAIFQNNKVPAWRVPGTATAK